MPFVRLLNRLLKVKAKVYFLAALVNHQFSFSCLTENILAESMLYLISTMNVLKGSYYNYMSTVYSRWFVYYIQFKWLIVRLESHICDYTACWKTNLAVNNMLSLQCYFYMSTFNFLFFLRYSYFLFFFWFYLSFKLLLNILLINA